jgi:hypothetical protein
LGCCWHICLSPIAHRQCVIAIVLSHGVIDMILIFLVDYVDFSGFFLLYGSLYSVPSCVWLTTHDGVLIDITDLCFQNTHNVRHEGKIQFPVHGKVELCSELLIQSKETFPRWFCTLHPEVNYNSEEHRVGSHVSVWQTQQWQQ